MLIISVAFSLWFFSDGPTVRSLTSGTVIEVNKGTTTSFRTSNKVTLVTVKVRLDDGSIVRLPVFGMQLAKGDRVYILAENDSDGQTRYKLKELIQRF